MGCVSSKHFRKEIKEDIIIVNNGGEGVKSLNHVVSLTSSTYGALKLDKIENQEQQAKEPEPIKEIVAESRKMQQQSSPVKEEPEVINTWELMKDLEEGGGGGGIPISNSSKKSPKSRVLLRGFADMEARSPLKFLNQFGSPRKAKTFGGKENKVRKISDFSPRPVFKSNNSAIKSSKAVLKLSYPVKESPITDNLEVSSRKRSLSPLFDPELVALYEKELSEEEGQIKRIICLTPKSLNSKKSKESESILDSFEKKCPPGGENAVVIYTTTLRGIRKTFEECNIVRSIIESYHIHTIERDVSMDSGFKEELRGLMGKKEVKVPLVFVKGRMVGGAEQIVKLDEEGKLEILFHGVPKRVAGECEGCGGIRFVMCMECNGSCKVLDLEQKKMIKCGVCNENGLIHCPFCC